MSSAPTSAATAPWADLLPELCDLVMERLDPVSNLRFRAVCKGWFAACEESPRLMRSGAPTLLTSGLDPDGCEIECDVDAGAFALHVVSPSSRGCGKSCFLGGEAEGLKGRTWVGGKDDWLATTGYGCDVELLNPVTGARVRLPSFATVGPGVQVPGYLHVVSAGGRWHKILKVTLCQTPAHRNGYLAVALFSDGLLAFTAAGDGHDESWTAFKNPAAASRSDLSYVDAIVLDGKLFAVNELGRVYSWDMDGGATTEPAELQGPPEIETTRHCRCGFYLAASSGGGGGQHAQLLLICIHGGDTDLFDCREDSRVRSRMVFDDRRSCFYELGMSLHELDAGGSGTWRRVTDLGGDRALFLGANYPFYVAVRRRSEGEDLEADCVYLADTPYGYDAAIFDPRKRDGHIRRLAYSLVADPLQMPMWFRPTAYPL